MYPDLEFRHGTRPVFVCDFKYKLLKGQLAWNADYYQLLAYVTALDLNDGLLIYCLVDGAPPPAVVEVLHSGIRLHTAAIDLTGDAADIDHSVGQLARLVSRLVAAQARQDPSGSKRERQILGMVVTAQAQA